MVWGTWDTFASSIGKVHALHGLKMFDNENDDGDDEKFFIDIDY